MCPRDVVPEAPEVDYVFEGSSSRQKHRKLPHVRALTDAPLSARGMEDGDFLADRKLSLFMSNILLRDNVKPLAQFVEDRKEYTFIDPLEFEELKKLLYSPAHGGVMHEIQQWRFTDDPTYFLFKRWRQDKFPDPTQSTVFTYHDLIYTEIRENEQNGGVGISIPLMVNFCEAVEDLYQFVESEIDPHIKRIWIENQLDIYQKWEGQTKGLPGRLTKDYVDERLLLFRSWLEDFKNTADGMIEYRQQPRINYNN